MSRKPGAIQMGVAVKKFNPEIEIHVWNTPRVLKFGDSEQLEKWLTPEFDFWSSIMPTNDHLRARWKTQLGVYNNLRNHLTNPDANRSHFERELQPMADGRVLTTDSPHFAAIAAIAKHNPNGAVIAAFAARADFESTLGTTSNGIPLGPLLSAFLPAVSDPAASATKNDNELVRLKNDHQKKMIELDEERGRLEKKVRDVEERETREHIARSTTWETQTGQVKEDWASLKKVYDTELGLRAPTSYWKSREEKHRNISIAYAVAFSLSVSGLILSFFYFGLPHLVSSAKESPTFILLPILLPAFAGIWALRILGRLLSENIKLMTDASERGTLVQTFLALMSDEKTGKSVIKDEDRILILHALFRPSSVTATDDAPPVHWFDLLVNKAGPGGRS